MADVIIKFEREDREGAVAVGSYLIDVIRRFGITIPGSCDRAEDIHHCAVTIKAGSSLLSARTKVEKEHFGVLGRKGNIRLACDAKITGAGEIVIMTEESKEEPKAEEPVSKLVEEFEALPLEKKIADLVRMEAVALGETVSFVVNSPMLVLEKIGDVLAEFGMKLEKEAKEAQRPAGDAADAPSEEEQVAEPKKKPSSRRPQKPADA
jgi:ferredoxin